MTENGGGSPTPGLRRAWSAVPRRQLLVGALGAITVGILAWGLLTPAASAPTTPAGRVARPLPAAPAVGHYAPNVTLLDLSGNRVTLASLRGQVVVVNFWYVGCESCGIEMPILERVYHAERGRGMTVVGLDMVDDAPTISGYIGKLGVDYLILRDPNQSAQSAYAITSTPTSFVIDRQGVIRARFVGAITDTQTLERALTPLLAQR